MHDSLVIANRFLELAHKRGNSLTPIQLLKLVYLAHGWVLGLYGHPLIKDEIQAWQYGPIIPHLYNHIRRFKGNPIEGLLVSKKERLNEQEENIIQQVYDIYGHLSGSHLSSLTHQQGSPWEVCYQPNEFWPIISNDIIEDYYQRQANAK